MTKKEFAEICSSEPAGSTVQISHQEFNLTGKLIGCGEGFFLFEVDGRRTAWPRELCESKPHTYPLPTYS